MSGNIPDDEIAHTVAVSTTAQLRAGAGVHGCGY